MPDVTVVVQEPKRTVHVGGGSTVEVDDDAEETLVLLREANRVVSIVHSGASNSIIVREPPQRLTVGTLGMRGPEGPPGVDGVPGPQGPQGEPGLTGSTYVHHQDSAAKEWLITHDLNRPLPPIVARDSTGRVITGIVEYPSMNTAIVRFQSEVGGVADVG